jgi:hypothetical protein
VSFTDGGGAIEVSGRLTSAKSVERLIKALEVNVMVGTAPAPASGSIESCAKMVVVEQPSEGEAMGRAALHIPACRLASADVRVHARAASVGSVQPGESSA